MLKVSFTGHRKIKENTKLMTELTKTLKNLITSGTVDFYARGALGWDIYCENAVLSLKEKYPQIKLHLVLPCSEEEQTAKWNKKQKEQYNYILESADSVEYTSEHYTKNCMKIRNMRLIELTNYCICYYTGRFISGTGQTVRTAQKKGITIINLYNI